MSEIKIRKAKADELDSVMSIYESARRFMKASGNPSQWGDVYPPRELINSDIESEKLYVAEDCDGPLAVFYFTEGPDPTYLEIHGGEWIGSDNYSVIHRIAVSERARGRGVAKHCFDYCLAKAGTIRIDTHRNNLAMQAALLKSGFTYCGVIRIERPADPQDDCERLAYCKTL